MSGLLQAVLFDLDGTLLDTAPDMVGALDELRAEHTLEPMDFAAARAHVSNGALGLLRAGFAHLDDDGREALRDRYLALYERRLCQATGLFPGMAAVLDALDAVGRPWGVVTNKPGYLTEPLLAGLQLRSRCACVVSGDTLARRKPHPDPLLHAAERLALPAEQTAYVGDASRDIEAGRAAGMRTVAAVYGYIQPGDDPTDWGADHQVSHPREILALLSVDTTAD